jgi:hypothetical protein
LEAAFCVFAAGKAAIPVRAHHQVQIAIAIQVGRSDLVGSEDQRVACLEGKGPVPVPQQDSSIKGGVFGNNGEIHLSIVVEIAGDHPEGRSAGDIRAPGLRSHGKAAVSCAEQNRAAE